MNAIFSLDTVTSSGGGQVILRTLAQAKNTAPTILFCPPGSLADEAEKHCKVVRIPKSVLSAASARSLRTLVSPFGPFETLHIHGISALGVGSVALQGLATRTVYTEHLLTKHYRLESPIHYWIQLLVYRHLIKKLDHIYCVSAAVMQFLRESLHVPAKKLSIDYNPVPKLIKVELPKTRQANTKVELVSIGSLVYVKNYAQLLHILKRIPNLSEIHLTIFGDGPEKNDLTALTAHLGLSEVVTFAGAVPHDQLISALLTADIYVQTSISESFGYGIAEAMQAGLPVIAFAVGGVPELVQDQYSGKLIPPYNEQAFARAIEELTGDQNYRMRLGKNAQKSVARYES
jgi:glycosyltransferase involved in cell wall biosynthesis